MATEVLLPQWGMEMAEGTIVKWFKQEGEPIEEGEPLVAIETAKLETDLESIASGVVAHILVPEGATVPIRSVLAVIAAPGEEVPRPDGGPARVGNQPPSGPPLQREDGGISAPARSDSPQERPVVQVVPAARRLAAQNGIDMSRVQGSGPGGRILIEDVERAIQSPPQAAPPSTVERPDAAPSRPAQERARLLVVPAARRLANQNGIDLNRVQASGPGGRILIEDVERAIQSPLQQTAQVVPLTGIRGTVATRMMQSLQTMAQVTLTTEANVTDAATLRQGLARQWQEHGLSPLHLVIKAVARGLKDHPRLNAIQQDGQVLLMGEINIGVAVSLAEGLITPVVRDADTKPLKQIALETRELAEKTREGRARPEDVTGGTFTVTNLGAYDVDGFTPIINPPQVGIMGVGRVVSKPVIRQGQVAQGEMMFLSLTFDHRVVDGAPAAQFLQSVKGYLEDPWWMVA